MSHSAVAFCVPFLTLYIPLLAIAQQPQTAPPVDLTFTIQYTGGLYGYARIPDVQTFTPPATPTPNSRAAIAYSDLFSKQGPPTLRLGMGDNFAPNLKARTISNPQRPGAFCPVDPNILVPKDRFYYSTKSKDWFCADQGDSESDAGENEIPADNVAQFFIENHYNALVPGTEDFYFGPEWLRSIAHLLGKNGVHMLAANLVISTSKAPDIFAMNTFPRIPPRYAKPGFSSDFGPASVDLPSSVLPYKQQFLVKNARSLSINGRLLLHSELHDPHLPPITVHPFITAAKVCPQTPTANNRDPNQILPDQQDCLPLTPSTTACHGSGLSDRLKSICASLKQDPSPDEIYLFNDDGAQLLPDTNYLFCAHVEGTASAADGTWACQPFSVQMPFFSWGRKPQDREVMPFELVNPPGQPTMAVFGVVDPDLLKNVGRINYAYWNKQPNLNTAVTVAAPDYSLRQALELCNATEACRSARKVLMAQMSLAKTSQLMAHFGSDFALVISQSDAAHDNRDATFSDSFDPDPTKFHLPLLVTPAAPASQSSEFKPILSTAAVSQRSEPGDTGRINRILQTSLFSAKSIQEILPPAEPCPAAVCLTVSQASHAVLSSLKALGAAPKPNSQALATPASQDVTTLALFVMRRALKTDIALLQKRDLYNVEALSSESIFNYDLQNQLQKVFWKGDFATSFFVTGATLRKILKQSAAFGELEHDSLASPNDTGRELLKLGVTADPLDSSTLYVNGAPVVDTLLYSVASSQYLGLGDTGYSAFATPDVPPPYRIEDFKTLKPIAALVCQAIEESQQYADVSCDFSNLLSQRPASVAPATTSTAAAHTPSKPSKQLLESFFDPASLRPFDETPGFNTRRHLTLLSRLIADAAPTSGANGSVQQRVFLSINLEDLDLGYSGTYINHVASSALTFAGISAPGVTTSGTNAINSDHRVRAILDRRHFTFYFVNDSTYMRTSNSSSSVPTLSANTVGYEGGGTLRVYHDHRPSLFSFQYSTRFQGDLTPQPPTAVTPTLSPDFPLQQQAFYLPVPKSNTLYGRLGLRFDHADTWIETGLEEIDSRHILQQYTFSNGVTCSPTAQLPLACSGALSIQDPALMLSKLSAPKFSTGAFLNSGAYLNFKIKIPLWSRLDANHVDQSWYFNLANKGDIYFNTRGDTATQTRFLDKFSPSFTIPLYGNLSLTPKVDFILFDNKVLRNHFRAVEPSLSLSYTFAWRQGMEILRTLGYGANTTAAGSPGSLP